MDIYLFNTGDNYALYYNPPKEAPKEKKRKRYEGGRIEDIEGGRGCMTTKELSISSGLEGTIKEAFYEFADGVKAGVQKLSKKMRTRTSGILHEAAYAGSASLNYPDTISEEEARGIFSRIVAKEKIKSSIIMAAGIIGFIGSYIPPLLFVPMTSYIFGPIVGYQFAVMRILKRGIKNVSFAQNPEVSKLEKIISGEKGLGLTNPDLIEYRLAKGL